MLPRIFSTQTATNVIGMLCNTKSLLYSLVQRQTNLCETRYTFFLCSVAKPELHRGSEQKEAQCCRLQRCRKETRTTTQRSVL